jgi:hypothetical protein
MKTILLTTIAALAMTAQMQLAYAKDIFVVNGDRITNASDPRETVRIGERVPVIALKQRFAKYRVRSAAAEDCSFCASVSRDNIEFSVDYDDTGIVVTRIGCYHGCVDALGNTIGTPLRKVLGSQASCDAGEETMCQSITPDLWYVVNDGERCHFEVQEGKNTPIPSCARIRGFSIEHIEVQAEPDTIVNCGPKGSLSGPPDCIGREGLTEEEKKHGLRPLLPK